MPPAMCFTVVQVPLGCQYCTLTAGAVAGLLAATKEVYTDQENKQEIFQEEHTVK